MHQNKISLPSQVLSGRFKKYDRYDASRSRRVDDIVQTRANAQKKQPQRDASIRTIATSKSQQDYQRPTPNHHVSGLALAAVSAARDFPASAGEELLFIPRRAMSRLQKALYGFGVMVLIFSLSVTIQTFITNMQAKEQVSALAEYTEDEQGVSEGSGSEPSEEPVGNDALAAYRVPNPEDPRYLRIPELQILARVKGLGVDKNGAVDAPWNIHDVGWYNESARPGNPIGSSLLLGHVSGWTGPGVFKHLSKLAAGSQFEVEKGSGEIIRYEVTKTEQTPLDQVNMAKILGTEVAGQHDLKLMTCSGKYNSDTKTYEDRFVVYAKRV